MLVRMLIYPLTSSRAIATMSFILHHSLELIAAAAVPNGHRESSHTNVGAAYTVTMLGRIGAVSTRPDRRHGR